MNTGDLWPDPDGAWLRVRRMQTKLHKWAVDDPGCRFDDLYNLVHHSDFLTVAWERVRGNKGARTAGVDRVIPAFIADDADIVAFLKNTQEQLKTHAFILLPVRERMIPKPAAGGSSGDWEFPPRWTGSCKPRSCWSWNRTPERPAAVLRPKVDGA